MLIQDKQAFSLEPAAIGSAKLFEPIETVRKSQFARLVEIRYWLLIILIKIFCPKVI